MVEVTQELFFDSWVGAQRQGEAALRPCQAPGLLNQASANCGELFEDPERRSPFGRLTLRRPSLHLKFSVQAVREDHCQQEGLVSHQLSDWDVIHLALRFQLGKNRLLSSSALMVEDNVPCGDAFVRNDDFELEAGNLWDKQIQLQRSSLLDSPLRTNDKEARAASPALGFPRELEVGSFGIDIQPAFTGLDRLLQFRKPLEGNRKCEFYVELLEKTDDGIAEECAVHSDLDQGVGQGHANSVNASANQFASSVGIMDISRSMVKVENLPGLGYGTKQRVVAALALLLPVEAHGGSFGMSTGSEDGAIEIQSHAAKLERGQAVEDDFASQQAESANGLGADRAEHSADRGDIGKFLESQHAKDHGILAIVIDISQLSVSQQDMDDQAQKLESEVVSGVGFDVAEAGTESIFELEVIEESLKKQQAGERAELLIGEFEIWESSGLTLDLFPAKLHGGDPPWFICGFLLSQIIPEEGRHFAFLDTRYCRLDNLTTGEVIQHRHFPSK